MRQVLLILIVSAALYGQCFANESYILTGLSDCTTDEDGIAHCVLTVENHAEVSIKVCNVVLTINRKGDNDLTIHRAFLGISPKQYQSTHVRFDTSQTIFDYKIDCYTTWLTLNDLMGTFIFKK